MQFLNDIKTNGYIILPEEIFKSNLSFTAKGLISQLLLNHKTEINQILKLDETINLKDVICELEDIGFLEKNIINNATVYKIKLSSGVLLQTQKKDSNIEPKTNNNFQKENNESKINSNNKSKQFKKESLLFNNEDQKNQNSKKDDIANDLNINFKKDMKEKEQKQEKKHTIKKVLKSQSIELFNEKPKERIPKISSKIIKETNERNLTPAQKLINKTKIALQKDKEETQTLNSKNSKEDLKQKNSNLLNKNDFKKDQTFEKQKNLQNLAEQDQQQNKSSQYNFSEIFLSLQNLKFSYPLPSLKSTQLRSRLQKWQKLGAKQVDLEKTFNYLVNEKGSVDEVRWYMLDDYLEDIVSIRIREEKLNAKSQVNLQSKNEENELAVVKKQEQDLDSFNVENNIMFYDDNKIEQIHAVFTHWQQLFTKKGQNLTNERIKLIANRLENFSIAELCLALDNAKKNPFFVNNNIFTLTQLFKNEDTILHLLEFRAQKEVPTKTNQALDSIIGNYGNKPELVID